MATKGEIAEDLKKEFGAFISITDIKHYTGFGRDKSRNVVVGLPANGKGKDRRYFYRDVAEVLARPN